MVKQTFFGILVTSVVTWPLFAAERYAISLVGQDKVTIGELNLQGSGDSSKYQISFDSEKFEDHFLSMRPFKCVPVEGKLWCHAPYPYEINRQVSDEDSTDLEYDLIFVWKPQGEYGINLWNGVYYRLENTETGWRGVMHEYDLNVLGVPPEKGELRPIREVDLHEADAGDHPFPTIEISKIQ